MYANGEDNQLEEIRAMNYWKKIKSEGNFVIFAKFCVVLNNKLPNVLYRQLFS